MVLTVPTILLLSALIIAICSAFTRAPLWLAVILISLALLVR